MSIYCALLVAAQNSLFVMMLKSFSRQIIQIITLGMDCYDFGECQVGLECKSVGSNPQRICVEKEKGKGNKWILLFSQCKNRLKIILRVFNWYYF